MAIDRGKVLAMSVRDYAGYYAEDMVRSRFVGVNIDGFLRTNADDDQIIGRFSKVVPDEAVIVLEYEVIYGYRAAQEWSGVAYSASGIAIVPNEE